MCFAILEFGTSLTWMSSFLRPSRSLHDDQVVKYKKPIFEALAIIKSISIEILYNQDTTSIPILVQILFAFLDDWSPIGITSGL